MSPLPWNELAFDPQSPTPIYHQLHQRIAAWIQSGRLADGARLLPTRELAGLLGINRATVGAAYEALENQGLLKAHVGRGSFVCSAARPAPFDWEQRLAGAPAERILPQMFWTGDGDSINFSFSRPDPALFPLPKLKRAAQRELAAQQAAILRLGAAEGYPPLREYLSVQMRREGIAGEDDELLITSGCQQGLDLAAKVLIRPGDGVFLEDPVYPGARDLFLAAGAQVRGIPVGAAGLSISELEHELARHRPRLLLVTPNFQNPTGATLPPAARRELLAVAARFQLPVLENDVYAGLRYRGTEPPTLKSLDRDGRVVYLRSFSKVAFPGLRVGWMVAPRVVARRLAAAKQLTDLHTDQLSQAVLYRLAAEGVLSEYLRELLRQGAARLEAVVNACRAEMPAGVEYLEPEGGMHVWLRLPPEQDAGELLGRARAKKVLFVPGRFFAVSRPHTGALRLSFAGLTPEKIRQGVAVLARLIRQQAPVPALLPEGGVPALV